MFDLTFITSPIHRRLVAEILEEMYRDPEIIGLFLQGSVARGDCYGTSDLDLYAVLDGGLDRPFCSEYQDDILVEIKYADVNQATRTCRDTDMGLYNFVDSVILFDRQSKLEQLKELAQTLIEQYQTPLSEKKSIAYWLESSLIKIKAAQASRDVLKASFVVSTTSWKIMEGIWAVNSRPVPPSGLVLYHLKYMDLVPENMNGRMKSLFAGDVSERIDAAIDLIQWIITNLNK